MKPATPLPWAMDYSANPIIFREGDSPMSPIAQTKGFDDKARAENSAYIVHAANAYPKLIEALLMISESTESPNSAAVRIAREALKGLK